MAEQAHTILIVDDLISNRHLLAKILELENYTVHMAGSGGQAVNQAPQLLPDLILMDVNMPGITGLEACRQLKEDDRTSDIPVIFISSANLTEDKLQGFEAGAVDYITRPFQPTEVLARVKAQLTIRQLQQQLQSANQALEARLEELAHSQTALQESEMRYRLLVDYSPLAILAHQAGKIVFANPAALSLLGYNSPQELLGKPVLDLVHPDFKNQEVHQIEVMNDQGTPVPSTVEKYIRQDGTQIDVEIMAIPYIYQRQQTIQVVIRDVTERKRSEETARYLSTHDILTNLYNRNYYETEIVRLQESRSYPISIAIADVDDLKKTNDTHGHSAGDILLQRVALVLQEAFRGEDMVARIGGDEFAVILPHTDEAAAAGIIERLKTKVGELNQIHAELPLHLSLGVATGHEPLTLPEIAKSADDAMYLDKAHNKHHNIRLDP